MKKESRLIKKVKAIGGVVIESGEDGFACQLPRKGGYYTLCVIVSWGAGWDHCSVHARINERDIFTPFWEDMAYVKAMFFKPSECVVQYHPPSDVYVNTHEHVLHLWRQQAEETKLPPKWMV